jgi:Lung seven transmembrane receptor
MSAAVCTGPCSTQLCTSLLCPVLRYSALRYSVLLYFTMLCSTLSEGTSLPQYSTHADGYLRADLFGNLPFYGGLSLLYSIVGIVWLVYCFCHR